MDLTNRVAIVTGGARGIGQAIAVRLAEAGASLVIADIGDAAPVVEQIKGLGRQAIAVVADVSAAADANRIVESAVATFGHADILVNNAGITRDQLMLRMSDEDWDAVLRVNLKSAFLCTRAVLRPMIRQRWGRIISISSVVGIVGNAGQANYASAKAGLIGLTKTISREVASRGITANAIAPGFIDTAMTQRLPEEQREALKKTIPAGFLGTPVDVANAVAFLASEEARYITGQVLDVGGGMAGAWM